MNETISQAKQQIHNFAENIIKIRKAVIEAVWEFVIDGETPKPEDGQLVQMDTKMYTYGKCTKYIFCYKGERKAELYETDNFDYYLHADKFSYTGKAKIDIYKRPDGMFHPAFIQKDGIQKDYIIVIDEILPEEIKTIKEYEWEQKIKAAVGEKSTMEPAT